MDCKGQHTVMVDGHLLAADLYGSGFGGLPLPLTAGSHTLSFRVRAKVRARRIRRRSARTDV